MRMAGLFLGGCLLLAGVALPAADDSLDTLRREQRELAATLHEKRTELIAKDEALKELHRKIMALHKELAMRLDNHRDLRDLVKQMRDIEARIRRREASLSGKDTPPSDSKDEAPPATTDAAATEAAEGRGE